MELVAGEAQTKRRPLTKDGERVQIGEAGQKEAFSASRCAAMKSAQGRAGLAGVVFM